MSLSLRQDLAAEFRAYADDVGVAPVDLLELLVTARVDFDDGTEDPDPAHVATDMLNRYQANRLWSDSGGPRPCTPLYDVALPPHVDVLILRLGPLRPDPPTEALTGGYPRTHIGANLTDTATDVWTAARGYWEAAQPYPQFLIATRLGRVMGCYAIAEWAVASSGRVWAKSGWRLHEHRAHPLGTHADTRRSRGYVGDEEAVADVLGEDTLLTYPPGPPRSRYRIRPGGKAQREAIRRWRAKSLRSEAEGA